ncbi:hypothetical protein K7X08_001960 [Anisodus acutangulus]|uniref:Peptidase A1 domain-containing protein n=1 Tax=Anisodus acutangulus TaxID=402998 RepID=A0A9Q1R3Q5_9SOLA|nr:hypothetical protein K7X08_001960 [Anisodus acutangulus]
MKLQLSLTNFSHSDLKPVQTMLQPEDLQTPITSGASQGSGEYFTRLGLSEPAKEFYMVLDTGSDITWVQCEPCSDWIQFTTRRVLTLTVGYPATQLSVRLLRYRLVGPSRVYTRSRMVMVRLRLESLLRKWCRLGTLVRFLKLLLVVDMIMKGYLSVLLG